MRLAFRRARSCLKLCTLVVACLSWGKLLFLLYSLKFGIDFIVRIVFMEWIAKEPFGFTFLIVDLNTLKSTEFHSSYQIIVVWATMIQ